jgi:NADH-quinone oxidoreductase subunit I
MSGSAAKKPSIASEFVENVAEICSAFVTSAQGMMVTAKYLGSPREIVTERYPLVRKKVAANYRGRLVNATERCIVCELCAKACPTQCIDMKFEIGADKKRILHNFTIDMTICLYCGLCTEACPDTTRASEDGEKCLTMGGGYEYSSHRKESIGFYHYAAESEIESLRAAAKERAEKAAAEKAAAAAAKAAAAQPSAAATEKKP